MTMTAAELAAAMVQVEKEFTVDWKYNEYARCKCGILLYFWPDATQLHSCEVCNSSFFHAQGAWEYVLNAHKARMAVELVRGHWSMHSTAGASSASQPPLTHLFIPSSINGVKVNPSCKDVFEKEIFVAYNKDQKIFDDEVITIGNIVNLECYNKYCEIYDQFMDRSDKMKMNKTIRDCNQEPTLIVKALIDLYTVASNAST